MRSPVLCDDPKLTANPWKGPPVTSTSFGSLKENNVFIGAGNPTSLAELSGYTPLSHGIIDLMPSSGEMNDYGLPDYRSRQRVADVVNNARVFRMSNTQPQVTFEGCSTIQQALGQSPSVTAAEPGVRMSCAPPTQLHKERRPPLAASGGQRDNIMPTSTNLKRKASEHDINPVNARYSNGESRKKPMTVPNYALHSNPSTLFRHDPNVNPQGRRPQKYNWTTSLKVLTGRKIKSTYNWIKGADPPISRVADGSLSFENHTIHWRNYDTDMGGM
ncbi:hypothetical protein K504DRAFT_489817 [Pleomassaria siparia CBS 279.74]|uniref:Uncharacterized protein n=1 Tax=Pleomassaria siparia CBS 279.74 TaxID=1314801 RepID=A0A6G1KDF8_9PLEO|nr:hypothetical protein K504DRAFT_489817 [Pleomassaria siparia CBS 279.74]